MDYHIVINLLLLSCQHSYVTEYHKVTIIKEIGDNKLNY